MRNERKIVIELIEQCQVHNYRLLAEFFAKKINMEGVKKHGE